MNSRTTISLNARLRSEVGKKVQKIRKSGHIPAVLYGSSLKGNVNLEVDASEFKKVFGKSGENTLIQLNIGEGKPHTVLVSDVQYHYLTDNIEHVDFYQVDLSKKLTAKVPMVFVGESAAVKEQGGVLVKIIDEVEVESLPEDLPRELTVDISKLKTFDDAVRISDIDIDASKIRIVAKPEDIVAKAVPPRSEEELKALEEKPVEEVAAVEGVVKETPATEGKPEEESKKKE